MTSNSRRKSGSSAGGGKRRHAVITPERSRDGVSPKSDGAKASKTQPTVKGKSRLHGASPQGKKSRASERAGAAVRARKVDPKRAARDARLAHQRRSFILRGIAVLVIVSTLVGGLIAVYRSAVFTIDQVLVDGAQRLTADQVRTIAAVPEDSTLLRYPHDDIVGRLEADPWIAEVDVSRNFPDGLNIRIVERQPVALVDVGEADFWMVDSEAVVLGRHIPNQTDTLPVVRDLVGFEPVEGQVAASDALTNALAVLAGLSPESRSKIRAVSAKSVDLTTLMTTEDVEILVGSADDIERKDVVAQSILVEQRGRVVYINVRIPDRPTWRGVDQP